MVVDDRDLLPGQLLGDQSGYVRATIRGVLFEGLIAACLTALMILIFLGSWRSTVIVALSIPLSVLTSIVLLWAATAGLALTVWMLDRDRGRVRESGPSRAARRRETPARAGRNARSKRGNASVKATLR